MRKFKSGYGVRIIAALMSLLMVFTSIPAISIYVLAEEISSLAVDDSPRLELNFNKNWKFKFGDVSGAHLKAYSDNSWDVVDLPHDFSIIQEFTLNNTEGESGSLPGGTGWYRKSFVMPAEYAGKSVILNFDGAYMHSYVYVNGTAIGENHYGYNSFSFDISKYLVYDGTTANVVAVKTVNQIPSSRWYSGSGITRDVTMTIVNPVHVSLYGTQVTTPDLASSNGADGTTNVKVTLQNDGNTTSGAVTVMAQIKNPSGTVVAQTSSSVTLGAGATQTVSLSMDISNPALWSVDTPSLYTMHIEVFSNDITYDIYDTTYGYTWSSWSQSTGFSLNGQNLKLQGVCMHHDQGALGAVQEHDAIYRQLSILKEMGVNTIRTSHNTPSKVLINICNELGILVMEEFFDGWAGAKNDNNNDFSTHFDATIASNNKILGKEVASSTGAWYEFVLKQSIKRDRNDPSIIIWDVGNEIGYNSMWPTYAANMRTWIDELDHRPVTEGNNRGNENGATGTNLYQNVDCHMDVIGGNYYPSHWTSAQYNIQKPFVATETTSAVGSRGVYKYSNSQSAAGVSYASSYQVNAYDASYVTWGNSAADAWYYTITNDWFSGEYVWTGFDYIGEPTPWNAHDRNNVKTDINAPNSSFFGIIDTAGFAKDSYYLYNSWWDNRETTLHLVPGTWNASNLYIANGYVDVAVYSNAPHIKLFRNGTEIANATGRTTTTAAGHKYITYTENIVNSSYCRTGTLTYSNDRNFYPIFEVLHDANAEITVKAYEADGVTEITDTVGTKKVYANSAAGIVLTPWNNDTTLTADGDSINYIEITAVDAKGNFVNDYNGTVNVTLTSSSNAAVIAGIDNGNQTTNSKFQSSSVLTSDTKAQIQMFNGKAVVLVKSTENAGRVNITVDPVDLDAKSIDLTVVAEKGEELTDEFEEVIDQSAITNAIEMQERYEFLNYAIADLDEPVEKDYYTLYTIGSGKLSDVENGSYIISGLDTSGNMTTGVLNTSSSATGTLQTSGSNPDASAHRWSFTRQPSGKYLISFTGQNITTEYLNISSSGLSVSSSAQELDVIYSNGTVKIGDGSNYITYSSSSANTAGVSASGTALRLYTVDGNEVIRWGDVGDVKNGNYIIYNQNYVMTNSVVNGQNSAGGSVIGIGRENATPDGTTLDASSVNEYTFTKVEDSADTYYVHCMQNASKKYINIIGNNNLQLTDTPQAITVSNNGNNTICLKIGSTYLDHFKSEQNAPVFSAYNDATINDNKKLSLYSKVEADSVTTISLYNTLVKGISAEPSKYTNESYTLLLDALQTGYEVYMDETSTDAEKTSAIAAIDTAYAKLEKNAISPTLKEDIGNLPNPGTEDSYILCVPDSGDVFPDGNYVLFTTYSGISGHDGVIMSTDTRSYSSSIYGFNYAFCDRTENGTKLSATEEFEWTITSVPGRSGHYYIQNSEGKYLDFSSMSNGQANLSDTPIEFSIYLSPNETQKYVVRDVSDDRILDFYSSQGVFTGYHKALTDNSIGINEKIQLYRRVYSQSPEKIELYNAMKTANGADASLYTTASYTALQRALQDGYDVYMNDNATASEVNAATQAINTAYANLKYVNLRPMLQNQINNLVPPAGSQAQYGRYTAKSVTSTIIPDGEYVISLDFNNRGTNGSWGVMTNTYVFENGVTWDGMGWAPTNAVPDAGSATWLIQRDSSSGNYLISRLNANGAREYLYIPNAGNNDNCEMSATLSYSGKAAYWSAEIDAATGLVKFRNTTRTDHLITFCAQEAWDNNLIDGNLYVSAYQESKSSGGKNLRLQRKENGNLVEWYAPVADGKYIVTQLNGNASQTTNTGTEIMDITRTSGSGAFAEVSGVTITGDKITTETDYELNFVLVEGTANQYYITNNAGQYLSVGSGNTSLAFTNTPATLTVEADAYGNVYIYRSVASGTMYVDHYDNPQNIFGCWIGEKNNNNNLRLFRYETTVSDGSVRQDLYKKLQEAIAIDQGNYSEESYNKLLLAIKDGIDSYNNDTTNAQWQTAIDKINAAIAALEVAKATFGATLYKYGYTPDSDYSSGGKDFNEIAYLEMYDIIYNTPELLSQIKELIGYDTASWTSDDQRRGAVEAVIYEYAKIYTLAFTGQPVTDANELNSHYNSYWNIWEKPGTMADGETNNEGASVQGIFSTTLGANGIPQSHDPYAELPYINTTASTDINDNNGIDGLHANVTMNIEQGSSTTRITLIPLKNISVHVPDYFSKNNIETDGKLGNPSHRYAKYYWDVQFPFVEYTNNYGVNTYVYDSSDADRVFQASFNDANHTATAQLTEITGDKGKVDAAHMNDNIRGFFPFNYKLYGANENMNTVEDAIYHFGMSFTTEFHIPTNGHYGDGKDIVFEFSGDDDVLVYIDNVLVLDNGGLHGARTASINFTDKSVSYQFVADVETGTVTNAYSEGVTYTYGMENNGISAQNQAAIDYLNKVATDGQQHTFTFYYLERGSTQSNCKISFNIQKISDYVKLIDQTYVVDFGLPTEFNVKDNNNVSAPEGYSLPTYEYIGVTNQIPASANSLVMFNEPTADEVTLFGSLSEINYEGNFGTYTINKNGNVKYEPRTMQFTDAGSIYLCAKIENDATYSDDTVYYAFEKVTIVPATTIYYEDDFEGDGITYTHGTIPSIETNTNNYGVWQDATSTVPTGVVKGEIYQNADEAGSANAKVYGSDQAYTDCATYSGYTSKVVTVSAKNNPNVSYSGGAGSSWPKAEFTFAGTGFDLISVTSKDTGAVQVVVKDADGKQVRNHTVNTYYGYSYGQLYRDANGKETLTETTTPLYFTANRDYTATPTYYAEDGTIVTKNTGDLEFAYAMGWIVDNSIETDNALYQIPIIKVEDLDYGSYTVTITPMYSSRMDMMSDGAYEFYLDAIRIYNPAGVGDSLTNPTISYTYTADKEANADYLELRNMLIGSNKLTNDGTSAKGAVFIDGITDNEDVSKYTSSGPNNELYLLKDQAVAFEIWASAIPDDVQIGAKAVGGSQPTMAISYTSGTNTFRADTQIRTSTDLYYSINDLLHSGNSTGYIRWTPVTGADGNNYYTTGTIVIQNTTDGIISITNLKWTFPSAGIGYYENLENGGAEVVSEEPVMLMSTYSTFSLARTALRMDYADLEIKEEDVTVENSKVSVDEAIVIKVATSTDVDTLVIRDENGNIITPEAVESYVETIDNKDVKQWHVTLSESESGTYTYTITGAYENGYESEAEPVVITVTVEKPEEITEPEKLSFLERLIGFINRIFDFFKNLIALFTGAEI